MKKNLLVILVLILMSSCVTSRGKITTTTDVTLNESYTTLKKVEGKAFSPKLWILFIPFGGSSDQGLYDRAYERALEEAPEADGITSQKVKYKKIKIPLLIITYVNKSVEVNGVAYQIKKSN